jgi:membrane-associated phospholipid phosphatase
VLVIPLVLIISAAAGLGAGIAIRAWPQADPARSATAAVEDQLVRWRRLRRFIRSRMDPATATGLALTVALLAVVVVGIGIARWAGVHTGTAAFRMLEFLTALGSTPVIIVVALAGASFGWWKRRDISIPFFFTLVVVGQLAASNLIKFAVERVRPDLGPLGPLGTPSFPSGHSTAAAATYAALALVLGRDRTPRARSVLAGIAVGIAVAVAGSRVLLGVHWFSDVVAGLALGWTWFALCAVAFGGRVLWFGAPAVAASTPAPSRDSVGSTR